MSILLFSKRKALIRKESDITKLLEKKRKELDDLEFERDFIEESGPKVLEQMYNSAS